MLYYNLLSKYALMSTFSLTLNLDLNAFSFNLSFKSLINDISNNF